MQVLTFAAMCARRAVCGRLWPLATGLPTLALAQAGVEQEPL